jgi:D-lactate dehydrogenase
MLFHLCRRLYSMSKGRKPPVLPEKYQTFVDTIGMVLPAARIITEPLKTFAYGTDASFYRLIPKVIVKSENEEEISAILKAAGKQRIPVTFRAAGTSLSGQAISDSVLVIAGEKWQRHTVLDNGARIRLEPGVIGRYANSYLSPYGRKIGPDPASINAAMIGGIAANNASGMCCGNSQNSYKTLAGMRIVFHNGSLLDTADQQSCEQFRLENSELIEGVEKLRDEVRDNEILKERIARKFKIKNTTGYSLNALLDYDDPIDIIAHLMIGSEGTLGFISEITYHTVVDHADKASALILFQGIHDACIATAILKNQPVEAVELMDRAALRSVENKDGMPSFLKELGDNVAALLVETRASSPQELRHNIASVSLALADIPLEMPLQFTDVVSEYSKLWNIRKGLFPAVGAVRQCGTTVIIEDVAFPMENLAEATLELQRLLAAYGYDNGIIFGHALAGNLHFVFTQDFGNPAEVARYSGFMDEVCDMVVRKYDGSLKAEHGTGRNMAPFVELEWGRDAYLLMERIKKLFDPDFLLNPGVILNSNPKAHLENLKPLTATSPIVDKCIECGFCEPVCPSKNLTLTPRQRITVQREISRLQSSRAASARLEALRQGYDYDGDATCATDGLCQMACPVDINTGDLTKELRRLKVAGTSRERLARVVADNYGLVTGAVRLGLHAVNGLHRLLGTKMMTGISQTATKISGNRLPLWTPYMPKGAKKRKYTALAGDSDKKVVYFPSCISRTMGPAQGDTDEELLSLATEKLLLRAGYEILYPPGMEKLCCGVPFNSKGAFRQADQKGAELEKVLLDVSANGRYPVLCDTSPCLYRMRQTMDRRLTLYEPVEFIHDFLLDNLTLKKVNEKVAVHLTCSLEKMGMAAKLLAVARRCAAEVVVPEKVGCCGFAGDRGFTYPELNAAALAELPSQVSACTSGYSNSRTCEIGLSFHSGIQYKSIVYLVERCAAGQVE